MAVFTKQFPALILLRHRVRWNVLFVIFAPMMPNMAHWPMAKPLFAFIPTVFTARRAGGAPRISPSGKFFFRSGFDFMILFWMKVFAAATHGIKVKQRDFFCLYTHTHVQLKIPWRCSPQAWFIAGNIESFPFSSWKSPKNGYANVRVWIKFPEIEIHGERQCNGSDTKVW